MAMLWALAHDCTLALDAAVCFGGVGVLAAMARHLAGERGTTAPLLAMSFWMMTAKQLGLYACFVFWLCFAAILLWRTRGRAFAWLAGCGVGLTALFFVVCASPYLTAWRAYGYPLYPAFTVDEARFPTRDLTQDFHMANADAEAMGRVGAFVNAYLSPTQGKRIKIAMGKNVEIIGVWQIFIDWWTAVFWRFCHRPRILVTGAD